MDMHSGGSQKESVGYIYIEAPQSEAVVIFFNKFGHSPFRVTCTCCGEDYSMTEYSTVENAYMAEEKVNDRLVIHAADIKPEWRVGEVPMQGYVWQD